MEAFITAIENANKWLNDIVWGAPMLILIVGTGIFLTIRTGFFQFGKFGHAMKNTIGKIAQKPKKVEKGAVTPFQAMTTALAATVGTGNIAGVAGAIAIGGPGAVFWMWLSALFGMATKYAEVVLALRFRERNSKGEWVGGPMYYIVNGLGGGFKWLAVLFAVFGALAAFGIGNMTQANTIAESVRGTAAIFNPALATSATTINIIVGVIVALFIAVVIIGGVKRVGSVTEKLVPFMSLIYIIGALIIVFTNIDKIGSVFSLIIKGAFQPEAAVGGVTGITIMTAMQRGVGRGVFSNEAGLGSAPIAHAASSESNPVKQGLYGIFEVFMDTIVICTLTALSILMSGVTIPYGEGAGVGLSISAFSTLFGGQLGSLLITIGIVLFATSTILSWSLYGTRCCEFLLGEKAVRPYQIVFIVFIVVGTNIKLDLAWNIADTLNGLMAIPNLVALLGLSGVVVRLTRGYR
ncbi:sodium:alanine symporter family protein, partial [Christensenellaceae bacterium OttesenSCG-928-M15]|nr:sodium:alanine symporter family protein [Christensenellaceae bacterium OttesenSCG-928-M15]